MSPGERMKHIRESVGISVIDAAVEFGITISRLERMENNKLPLSFMVAIQAAHLYKCDLEDFSERSGRSLPPNKRLHIN